MEPMELKMSQYAPYFYFQAIPKFEKWVFARNSESGEMVNYDTLIKYILSKFFN